MENILITCFRGYSQVIGHITLAQFFNQIREGNFHRNIEEIRKAMEEGNTAKADRIKRQLPYFTLTGVYAERRQPYSLTAYQNVRLLDFDDMPREELGRLRKLAEADPATLFCALSPRRHGLKLLVSLQTEETARIRQAMEKKERVTYAELEQYHKRMFELEAAYYERLLGSRVDTSGSDLARGMYATHDPAAFYSEERLALVKALRLPVPPEGEGRACVSEAGGTERKIIRRRIQTVRMDGEREPDPLTQLEFRKAVEYTRRKFRFEEGSRDSFVYCLGAQCHKRHIDEEDAVRMALRRFGCEPGFDAETPVRNAYRYTKEADEAEREAKKPLVRKVMDYLEEHYRFRRHTVLDRVEYAPLLPDVDVRALPFQSMRGKDYNTLYTQLQLAELYCPLATLRAVIDSDFAPDYNPF